MMPTTIVNAKPCSTSPPKKNSASAVRSAVPDVMIVRPSVWFTDALMTWCIESRRIDAQVLADPVEDDDRVVGREAGHRQDRGDDVQRHVVAEEREERQRDQQVVNRRDDGADAEAELEAEGEIREDADERQHGRRECLCSSARWPTVGPTISVPSRLEVADVRLLQRVVDLLRRRAERRARLGADRRHADHDLVLRRIAVRLHDRVLAAAREVRVERGAHLLDRRRPARTAR